ncbi:MAG TPA: efflux RND transporter periplasmic adaptor subunit [Planctomycetota bacterium]|nr:efflux RND transporter periplasmic adaptor subunit [Planctomycetota bacterium]
MAPEGLAALKIDRTRQRAARRTGRWITVGVVAVLAVVAVVLIAPRFQAAAVAVQPVVKAGISGVIAKSGGSPELAAAGYIVADRKSVLAAKVTGRLIKVNVSESQRIKQGDPIAEVDHQELDALIEQTKAELAAATQEIATLKKTVSQNEAEFAAVKAPLITIDAQLKELDIKLGEAKRKLERDRRVAKEEAMPMSTVEDREYEVKAASAEIVTMQERRREQERRIAVVQAQVDVAKEAVAGAEARKATVAARIKVLEKQREDYFVWAPFDGVITEKAAEVGEIVAPISVGGMMARGSVATLADWNSLQAEVDVAEAYIGRVKDGQRAAITVDAFPDRVFPGKVRRILPRANRSKATVQVRVDFLERDEKILPDMGVRVKFLPDDAPAGAEKGEVKEKILLPKAAIQGTSGAQFVWVAKDNVVSKRTVTVGETVANDYVEALSGVVPGETVVVRGAESLNSDGQRVTVQ